MSLAAVMLVIVVQVASSSEAPSGLTARLLTTFQAHGVPCTDLQYWVLPPKTAATVSCNELQIYSFEQRSALFEYVFRRMFPVNGDILWGGGRASFLIEGRHWLVLTPSTRIASIVKRTAGGRVWHVPF